jgi:sn-glycerol 3-phosphate transport system substrate-binding protein
MLNRQTCRMVAAAAAIVFAAALAGGRPIAAAGPVEVSYWFPVDLGGGLANVMQILVTQFNQTHPGVHVTASYTGNYDATLQKVQAAQLAGNLPDVAVVVNEHTQLLAPTGILAELDPFIARAGGNAYLNRFFTSLLLNSYYKGKMYSLPYQRSVPVLYYNKDAFREAGIAQAPATWADLVADAQKLTVRQGGPVTRWGLEFPLEAYNWIYYALVYESGGQIISADLKHLYLDRPPAVEAMQFWHDLVHKYKVTPAYTPWPQGSQDFVAGKTAMVVYSSGSQAFFRQSAKFAWSLTRIPKNKRYGVAPGGGNFVLFKKPPEQQQAAWTFVSWMVEPRQTAYWSANSGYIAVMKEAWALPQMKQLVAEHPEVLATVEQLKDAYYEPGAPNFTQIRDLLHDMTQDILANKIPLRQGLAEVTTKGNAILAQTP